MGFIEGLFQSAYDRLQQKKTPPTTEAAVSFDFYRDRLTYLAASLSPLPVKLAGSSGADQNSWRFRQGHLFLPVLTNVFASQDENYDVLKFRLIVELLSLDQVTSGATVPEFYSLTSSNMMQSHLKSPLLEMALDIFVSNVSARLEHVVTAKNKISTHAQALLSFQVPEKSYILAVVQELEKTNLVQSSSDAVQSPFNHIRKKKITETKEISLSDPDMNPLVHSFEKIHTLDDYTGGNKQIDDSDELNSHARALDELELNTVVRTNQTSNGTIEGDISRQSEIQTTHGHDDFPTFFRYDEWNEGKGRYLSDWCRIQEHSITKNGDRPASTTSEFFENFTHCHQKGKDLHQRLAAFFNTKRWKSRQLDGPELDITAIIDNRVEWLRGKQPGDSNYQSLIKTELDFALTILCDSSLSTEAWVAGRQVHKIIRDAATMLSYALQGLRCNWSVAAFNSFTHDDCHYYVLKNFSEDASMVRKNIGVLRPDGYTRMGPALRHAGFRLDQLRAKENMVIIITDAKPTDYDHYEGSYGVKDVKRAVGELKAKNIHTYAISISDRREDQAARMFGHAMAQCTSPDRLSELIFSFFVKFISRH